MDEYIERETLLNSICNKHCDCDYDGECPNCRLTEPIVAAPAAAAAPVRHGSIIETIEDGHMKRVFSCCGTDFTKMTCWMTPKYCPYCGAKMDGGADNG